MAVTSSYSWILLSTGGQCAQLLPEEAVAKHSTWPRISATKGLLRQGISD